MGEKPKQQPLQPRQPQQFQEPPRVHRAPGAPFFPANHPAGIAERRFQIQIGGRLRPFLAGQQVGAAGRGRPGPGEQLRQRDPNGDARMADAFARMDFER